jgi:ATP-dependent DNA helicase PIF1
MLNKSQDAALQLLLSNKNVFLTGAAGTGKSFLINHYRKHFAPKVPVVSSTGAAAVLVNGRTFHSFFGLGTMHENYDIVLQNAISNPFLNYRIKKLHTVIIDEISMLSGRALDLANLICKTIKNQPELPFGGVRLIIVGDFYQLPPVSEKGKIDWAFESFSWQEANFECFELKEFMRTTEDEFLKVLSNIRSGRCTRVEEKFLNDHVLKPNEGFVGTRIFARKNKVLEYNEQSLNLLEGEFVSYQTIYQGEMEYVDRLKRSLPIDEELRVKEEALVMIRINDNSRQQLYVNGTLGHIQHMDDEEMLILTLNGRLVTLKKHLFQLKDGDGEVLASAKNFPITVAYAITIHKSQGATIDQAVVELSNLWDSGQAYTALSRLSNSAGLRLLSWDKRSIKVDQKVINFYKQINENQIKPQSDS